MPCVGAEHKYRGQDVLNALSFSQVDRIAEKFNELNPYNRTLVRNILKIEDINHEDSDTGKPRRQLFGYAISAKRYALYEKSGTDISIVKASGHGLGYLFAPKEVKRDEQGKDAKASNDDDVPAWIMEAWDWLLRKELKLRTKVPSWLDLPAMMRMGMTSPNVMRNNRPEWLSPFNFFLCPMLSPLGGGEPAGFHKENFKFITPAESDRSKWPYLWGINLLDKYNRRYRIKHAPRQNEKICFPGFYANHSEKLLATSGSKIVGPGRINMRWRNQGACSEEGGHCCWQNNSSGERNGPTLGNKAKTRSLESFSVHQYRHGKNLVVAQAWEIAMWNRSFGKREMIRKSNLAQPTVYAILNGEPVKPRIRWLSSEKPWIASPLHLIRLAEDRGFSQARCVAEPICPSSLNERSQYPSYG